MASIYKQNSNVYPGSRDVLHEHILLGQGSLPESAYHNELERQGSGALISSGRHRLANAYVENGGAFLGELQLDQQGHKVGTLQRQPSILRAPTPDFAAAGARCQVQISTSGLTGGGDSPTKVGRQAAKPPVLTQLPTPTLSQRSIFEATRGAMLDGEGAGSGQFSPLSPGCPNSSRHLAELFGLFRGDTLDRTTTEGPDALLSQVAAAAADGEFDNLGDPADLRDLVSTDSVLTDASGYSAGGGPFSSSTPLPLGGNGNSGAEAAGVYSSAAPRLRLPAGNSLLAAQQQQLAMRQHLGPAATVVAERAQRAATTPAPVHTTQIVLAPRAPSVPEVPMLPAHLATGPPSPVRHAARGFPAARRSGLEVSGGGVAKRWGMKSRGSSGELSAAVEDDAASQRSSGAGSDGDAASKPSKAKRSSAGDRRPRRMTCNYCKTHVTPQWRCGPDGPRTLCNACGVRWGKGKLELPDGSRAVHPSAAKKAAAAAAAAAQAGTLLPEGGDC